jgi:phage-related protein
MQGRHRSFERFMDAVTRLCGKLYADHEEEELREQIADRVKAYL